MIQDCEHDIENILMRVPESKTLVIPILANPHVHPCQNPIVAVYLYNETDECMIPMRHTEQIRGFTEHLQRFLDLTDIFVYDKKQWLQIGGNTAVWDVKTLWWYTYAEAYNESYYPTAAHTFFWRRHPGLQYINAIIPLQQHLAMCQKIRHYAWPMCINAELDKSYIQFNDTYPAVFAQIETAGLCVNSEFTLTELIHDNMVYSQYNYHTVTGRPSNAFRGFNFAAMNKEDGTRAAFCSRFPGGALVEMDFDSYHVRLIARLIGYHLPSTSVHDYLGQFYFGVSELTDAQRNESKAVTFRLLYGGIDADFLTIPFFRQVNEFIYQQWASWKRNGYIETPILKRHITKDMITNVTANKLFNYYLQAVETEVSVQKLKLVLNYLEPYQSRIILYTYDSILFDMHPEEAKRIISPIRTMLEKGNLPVKIKYGASYHEMKEPLRSITLTTN
jgi:hypothetical protein